MFPEAEHGLAVMIMGLYCQTRHSVVRVIQTPVFTPPVPAGRRITPGQPVAWPLANMS